jgi:hypothetical protein
MSDPENHFTRPEVTEGYGHSFTYYRWKPYRPAHAKQSKKLGRWQKLNEYGGFENCEAPHGILRPEPLPIDELFQKIADLELTVRHQREEIGKLHAQLSAAKDGQLRLAAFEMYSNRDMEAQVEGYITRNTPPHDGCPKPEKCAEKGCGEYLQCRGANE